MDSTYRKPIRVTVQMHVDQLLLFYNVTFWWIGKMQKNYFSQEMIIIKPHALVAL